MKVLLAPPTLRERRHRFLAGGGIAVRGSLDVVPAMAARPHPRTARWRSRNREDAADDLAVLQRVVVLLVVADRRTLEDQRISHQSAAQSVAAACPRRS